MKSVFGLIGYPLTHSFSKKYFSEKFSREGLSSSCSYENFELKSIDEFPGLIAAEPFLKGLNVTIPYKEKIISFLDEVDSAVHEIGAVNTILITRNGNGSQTKTKGFNTDVYGFEMALLPHLKAINTGAMVLGTGGASKAVVFVLKKLGIPAITVSRKERADAIRYNALNAELMKNYPVIINTTPLGTFPDTGSFPPIPYEHLDKNNLLFDLVYNPSETAFMEKGLDYGAAVKNGYDMLVFQAEAAWKIWQSKGT